MSLRSAVQQNHESKPVSSGGEQCEPLQSHLPKQPADIERCKGTEPTTSLAVLFLDEGNPDRTRACRTTVPLRFIHFDAVVGVAEIEGTHVLWPTDMPGSAARALAIRQIGRAMDDSVSVASTGALNSSRRERMTDFAVVKLEFDETLGYIRQDLRWLLEKQSSLNHTIALLIVCGCEMLAACGGDKKRLGERMFRRTVAP